MIITIFLTKSNWKLSKGDTEVLEIEYLIAPASFSKKIRYFGEIIPGDIRVSISSTLLSLCNFQRQSKQLEAILINSIKNWLIEKIKDSGYEAIEDLVLTTYDLNDECPKNISLDDFEFPTIFEIEL